VHASRMQSIEDALAGLGKPAAPASEAQRPPVARAASAPTNTAPAVTSPAPAPVVAPPVEIAPAPSTGDFRNELHQALIKERLNISADALEQAEINVQGGDVVLRGPKSLSFALKDKSIERLAGQLLGKPVRIRFEAVATASPPPTPASVEKNPAEDSELRRRALSHPGVKRFQELFPEAQVRTVRNLND
jgi:hypothetical protein